MMYYKMIITLLFYIPLLQRVDRAELVHRHGLPLQQLLRLRQRPRGDEST